MRQFIPIQKLSSLYASFSDLLTADGLNSFIQKLQSEEGKSLSTKVGLNEDDIRSMIISVSTPRNVLFYDWVDQNKALKKLLIDDELSKFEDLSHHLKHQFIDDYRVFISPYLSNRLLKYSGETKLDVVEKAFSFVQLLDKNHRATVESELFKSIKNKVETGVSSCKALERESELIKSIKPLCDDKIISSVNTLSRASYSYKLEYVDSILSVLKFKSCTPRFANWVLKKLELVELNHEHEYKVRDLRKELKEGELELRNNGKGRTPIKRGSIVTVLLIGLVAGLTFWVVKFKPFSDVDDPNFDNETSFMQFSKEERKKIDSLLIHMNGNLDNNDLMIDQGFPLIGESDQLTFRKTFNNETLERIYQDLIKDADTREGKFLDSCKNNIPFAAMNETELLKNAQGMVEGMMKNESEYDVIIFITEDRRQGKSYTLLLKKGETKTFKMNQSDNLMVIPGNLFSEYVAPLGVSPDELPSDKFKHYFCEIDYNYKESVHTVYQLTKLYKGKAKFLLMGDKGSLFHVIDINDVLEEV